MSAKRYKLLLIRGLEHSGTTILDLSLGKNSKFVGLGEAARLVRRPSPMDKHDGPLRLRTSDSSSHLCTCGVVASKCSVWGDYLTWLVDNDSEGMPFKYANLLDRCAPRDSSIWAVDSYQDDLTLLSLPSEYFDLRIIHLVRDIRSWLPGRIKAARREGLPFSKIRGAARWVYVNTKFARLFDASGIPVFRLGYEEFAMHPEVCLRMICKWVNIPFNIKMLTPGDGAGSHVLLGNSIRKNNSRIKSIKYDASWMSGSIDPVSSFCILMPFVNRMNQNLVYSNSIF